VRRIGAGRVDCLERVLRRSHRNRYILRSIDFVSRWALAVGSSERPIFFAIINCSKHHFISARNDFYKSLGGLFIYSMINIITYFFFTTRTIFCLDKNNTPVDR